MSLNKKFLNYMQSGWYIDYVTKKLSEMFVRNIFIYGAVFFGEKFVIEFVSKKTIDNLTLFVNNKLLNKEYQYNRFYNNFVMSITGLLVIAEIYYLFLWL